MREGWYEANRREQVANGKRAFQAKTVVLTADRQQTIEVRPQLINVVEMD